MTTPSMWSVFTEWAAPWALLPQDSLLRRPSTPQETMASSFGNPSLLANQALSVVVAWVYSFVVTWIILKILDRTMGLRVSDEHEVNGLDLSQHGESGYSF